MDPYLHWQRSARSLLEPLAALMAPGRADLPIRGAPSDHDAQADRLESFARPLTLAAFYLQSVPESEANGAAAPSPRNGLESANLAAFREKISAWFRAALVLGTEPASPQYFGPDANYHQHHVEMGLAAIALQLAPAALWTPLTQGEKDQVAAWFATSRGGGIVNNNHLFMSVHILEFLGAHGYAHRTDRAVVTAHLNQLETMHRGGGWFEDGINQAYDHYNAYAFHFYGLMWARLHGARDTARAGRWRAWTKLFVADYAHFFAASGEHPAFGRSITYRFNGLNVFGLALAEGCTDLAAGMLRRLCTRSLDFFLTRPITNEQGVLAPGFTDRFDRIVEPYSAPASPYWTAKGFTPLLLPPSHAFWTAPEEPLPAELPGGFVRVMPAPGLVTRSTPAGEVEILNAGSMVGNTQLRYGAWKWSKLSYRTGVHFTYAFPEISNYSFDSALTQQLDDGRIFGRHSTVALELDERHLGYSYNLGAKVGQINTSVETYVFWRAGWLLHVHHIVPRQPVVLRLGGFALPAGPKDELTPMQFVGPIDGRPCDQASVLFGRSHSGRETILQLLGAPLAFEWDLRTDDSAPRRHVADPYHLTPVFRTERSASPRVVIALSFIGPAREHTWAVKSSTAEHLQLAHPTLGTWSITHWSLPALV